MTATLRVPAGEDSIFNSVAAFEPNAAARLSQMRKGGAASACGVLEVNNWTTKEGELRTGWRLTASEILTPYAATKKRRDAGGDEDGR